MSVVAIHELIKVAIAQVNSTLDRTQEGVEIGGGKARLCRSYKLKAVAPKPRFINQSFQSDY